MNSNGGVRRQDTTKGPPLRILSLDGGGVRGYSMLILLQELMHRTFVEIHGTAPRRNEIPKPCDHFDLIVGTGTGGLIAIMLGRLRMDLETCKEVYVRMTRRVFETDKTIAGIPYRSTLFKASKLEEAIRECVSQHTVFDDEGNDTLANAQDIYSPNTPTTPNSAFGSQGRGMQRSFSNASRASGMSSPIMRHSLAGGRFGNPNALLYDTRENRTKTAVTAVYKGTSKNGPPAFLRSYDSRKEPAPEFECSIWQAGRATSAIGLAFKPIQIGQTVFTDEGNGRFNPSPYVLDEACMNEYPGRDVGVFVSIGTGKRPNNTGHMQSQWYESFLGGSLGDFAEAKRRLFAKIEGCEETHQYMVRDHLAKRGVHHDNYYRLNVEVGVGEFGMNEWNRLSDVSINTRHYLNRQEVQAMNYSASSKMARIHKAKVRWDRAGNLRNVPGDRNSWEVPQDEPSSVPPPSNPLAVELPADEGYSDSRPSSQYAGGYQADPSDKYPVATSDEFPQVVDASQQQQRPVSSVRPSVEAQYQAQRPGSSDLPERVSPPPLPPKTPIGVRENRHTPSSSPRPPHVSASLSRPPAGAVLPYPDVDGPPPVVNMARKPQYGIQ